MKDNIKLVLNSLSPTPEFYAGDIYDFNISSEYGSSGYACLMLPYSKSATFDKMGMVGVNYQLALLFLKKSILDEDYEDKYDQGIAGCIELAEDFVIKFRSFIMKDYVPSGGSLPSYRINTDRINIADVNYDGVLLTMDVNVAEPIDYCGYTAELTGSGPTPALYTQDFAFLPEGWEDVYFSDGSQSKTINASETSNLRILFSGGVGTIRLNMDQPANFTQDFSATVYDQTLTKSITLRFKATFTYVAP